MLAGTMYALVPHQKLDRIHPAELFSSLSLSFLFHFLFFKAASPRATNSHGLQTVCTSKEHTAYIGFERVHNTIDLDAIVICIEILCDAQVASLRFIRTMYTLQLLRTNKEKSLKSSSGSLL